MIQKGLIKAIRKLDNLLHISPDQLHLGLPLRMAISCVLFCTVERPDEIRMHQLYYYRGTRKIEIQHYTSHAIWKLDRQSYEAQLVDLVAILAIETHNLPSVFHREFLAFVGHLTSANSVPSTGRGQQVEVASVVLVLTLAQLGPCPVFVVSQHELVECAVCTTMAVLFAGC